MEELTKAKEDALTENHTPQMEALIRSTTGAMKEMMTLVKSNNKNPTNANNGTNEKKTKWQEKTEQIQRCTCMQTLQQKTPKPTGKQMLGTQIQRKNPAQPGGDLIKAPEGVRGQQ